MMIARTIGAGAPSLFAGAGVVKTCRVCALLLTGLLPGCADSYVGARALALPGKLDHNTCEQLAASHRGFSARIAELERLQRKAESETAGLLVSGMAYGLPITQARADRRIVEETQAEKKCEEKPKP